MTIVFARAADPEIRCEFCIAGRTWHKHSPYAFRKAQLLATFRARFLNIFRHEKSITTLAAYCHPYSQKANCNGYFSWITTYLPQKFSLIFWNKSMCCKHGKSASVTYIIWISWKKVWSYHPDQQAVCSWDGALCRVDRTEDPARWLFRLMFDVEEIQYLCRLAKYHLYNRLLSGRWRKAHIQPYLYCENQGFDSWKYRLTVASPQSAAFEWRVICSQEYFEQPIVLWSKVKLNGHLLTETVCGLDLWRWNLTGNVVFGWQLDV